jgi:hypothetical protein
MTGVSLPDVVQRVFDATNAGDSAAFVQCFAADGVIDDWGHQYVGTDAIAGWNRTDNIGVQSHIEVRDASGTNPVTVSILVSGNGYNGGGTFEFTTQDGAISRLTIRG